MASPSLNLSLPPPVDSRKRPILNSDSDSDEKNGWKTVTNKKQRKQEQQRTATPKQAPKTSNTLSRFKVVAGTSAEGYRLLSAFNTKHPNLKLTAKPNLKNEWILSSHDDRTVQMLKNTSDLNLIELNRNERLVKAVVIGFPFSIPGSELAKHERIANVERMRNKEGQETKAMLCSFIGDRPDTINLGMWGTFKVRVYHPEPLRCFNCQKFWHHKSECLSNAKCAVCSGRHETSICIAKHKAGEQTHPRCPNCKQNHPAWSRRCPERLDRIKASLPPEPERKRPTPLPRRHFYSRAELQRRSQSRKPRESSQRRTPAWNNQSHGRTAPKTLPRTIFCNTDSIKNCFASFIQVALINAKATLSMDNIETLSTDFLESLWHASRSLQPIPSKAPPPHHHHHPQLHTLLAPSGPFRHSPHPPLPPLLLPQSPPPFLRFPHPPSPHPHSSSSSHIHPSTPTSQPSSSSSSSTPLTSPPAALTTTSTSSTSTSSALTNSLPSSSSTTSSDSQPPNTQPPSTSSNHSSAHKHKHAKHKHKHCSKHRDSKTQRDRTTTC